MSIPSMPQPQPPQPTATAGNPLAHIPVAQKLGTEAFHHATQPAGFSLIDFWRWCSSDLLNNAWRGVLAEYIVAKGLGLATDNCVRTEWDACDFRTPQGLRVEVKSAAYLQSWHQDKHSAIQFSIKPTRGWDAPTNTFSAEICRQSDLYIFCLLAHKHKATVDPLNLTQWEFYMLPTKVLNERCPTQQMMSLNKLLNIGARGLKYEELQPVRALRIV